MITGYHAKYYANELTCRHAADSVDRLSQSLFDASVDLNPHQIDAALFALRNPLQQEYCLLMKLVWAKPSRQHWCYASTGRATTPLGHRLSGQPS